jgi:ribosome-associated heat shock protein Hsp15
MSEAPGDRQRIDKWLWFARLAKSRTLAQKLVAAGNVRINRERNASTSRLVRIGDTLTVSLTSGVRVLRIAGIGARRGPAVEARALYIDLTPAAPTPSTGEPSGPRPTKRNRRAIDALRRRSGDDFS